MSRPHRLGFDQALLAAFAVLLSIAIGGLSLSRLARAGDQRLWSEA